jgi:peptidoglycan/LPS O-acetylase OafA/YrhL
MCGRAYSGIIGSLTKRGATAEAPRLPGARTRPERHRGLDGLRGLAILLVVAFHTWLFSWYTPALALFGYQIPVDDTGTGRVPGRRAVLHDQRLRAVLSLRRTGARRAARSDPRVRAAPFLKIVPSYALALTATALASASRDPKPALLGSVANHVLFVQNFSTTDGQGELRVLEPRDRSAVLPDLSALAWAFVRRPLPWPALMLAAAIAYRYGRLAVAANRAGHASAAGVSRRLCMRDGGCVRARLAARARAAIERFAPLFTLVALAATAGGLGCSAAPMPWPTCPRAKNAGCSRTARLFAADGAIFGLASCLAAGWWRRIVANPVLLFLGVVSYNLYLWHTLVLIWMWKHGVPPAATPTRTTIRTGSSSTSRRLGGVPRIARDHLFHRAAAARYGKLPPFSFDWRRRLRRSRRRKHAP